MQNSMQVICLVPVLIFVFGDCFADYFVLWDEKILNHLIYGKDKHTSNARALLRKLELPQKVQQSVIKETIFSSNTNGNWLSEAQNLMLWAYSCTYPLLSMILHTHVSLVCYYWQWLFHTITSLRDGKRAVQTMCEGFRAGGWLDRSLQRRCHCVCKVSLHLRFIHYIFWLPSWLNMNVLPTALTKMQWIFRNMAGTYTYRNTFTKIYPKDVGIYWHPKTPSMVDNWEP